MENVIAFNYLGSLMTAVDDDWTEVAFNLHKARKCWGCILIREGADTKVLGHFFKVLVQAVLLFGA